MIAIDLGGRVAVVTGGASGIGLEIARTLAEAGARVALADVDEARLAGVADVGLPVRIDVTDHESARAGLAQVRERLGSLDVLVNNAGIAAPRQGMPFTNQEKADWQPVLAVNAIGTFVMSREFVLQLGDGAAAIVNIASVSGRTGFQTDPGYSASKAAVINFTQVAARDLAPRVRVNCVCPGMVMTPFYQAQFEVAAARDPEVARRGAKAYFDEKAQRLIPLGRGQEPRDVANAVAFLASDLAASITGQALNVDGGLIMS
jgi:NAD(P)-dependent dehydrogenase (short-subunit alcohol dehydrogenase family)